MTPWWPAALAAWAALAAAAPPRQSDYQRHAFKLIRARASLASRAATPSVLAALDDAGFRALLAQLLPDFAALGAAELLRHLRDEIAVAEMIHNLPANTSEVSAFNAVDADLAMLSEMSYLPNQWEVGYVRANRSEPGTLLEWMLPQAAAETGMYGLRPFTGGGMPGFEDFGGWPASLTEAEERPVYTSLNVFRVDMGVSDFGGVGLVLRRSWLENITVVSAVDTGAYESMCNETFVRHVCPEVGTNREQCGNLWFCFWDDTQDHCVSHIQAPGNGLFASPDCSSWDGTPGTLEHFHHMILPNAHFWNRTCCEPDGSAPPEDWRHTLAVQFARLLGGWRPRPAVPLRISVHGQYWEANVLGAPLFPDGVQLVLGDFPKLFGTEDGRRLQAFARRHGLALAWALGPNRNRTLDEESSYADFTNYAGDGRLLDPQVLDAGAAGGTSTAGCNLSLPLGVAGHLDEHWRTMAELRAVHAKDAADPYPPPRELARRWAALVQVLGPRLRVESLRARRCADTRGCVGTTWEGDCVCYDTCRGAWPAPGGGGPGVALVV